MRVKQTQWLFLQACSHEFLFLWHKLKIFGRKTEAKKKYYFRTGLNHGLHVHVSIPLPVALPNQLLMSGVYKVVGGWDRGRGGWKAKGGLQLLLGHRQ